MSQYSQLLLLYDQLLTMADEVKDLIEREYFDDILNKVSTRDRVSLQIKLAKKCTKLSDSEQSKIDKMEKELLKKEKANIELMQVNMAKVKTELDKLNLRNKLRQAYGKNIGQQGSIIDIDDSYRPEPKK